MYIVFPIRFNRLPWCNDYLASLPSWRPRFDSRGRKYFFVFNFIFPIFYIFYNKSLVAFYIKFNALAKSSHQTFFFINFQIQNALSVMVTDMRLCQTYKSAKCLIKFTALHNASVRTDTSFLKFAFCHICVATF